MPPSCILRPSPRPGGLVSEAARPASRDVSRMPNNPYSGLVLAARMTFLCGCKLFVTLAATTRQSKGAGRGPGIGMAASDPETQPTDRVVPREAPAVADGEIGEGHTHSARQSPRGLPTTDSAPRMVSTRGNVSAWECGGEDGAPLRSPASASFPLEPLVECASVADPSDPHQPVRILHDV